MKSWTLPPGYQDKDTRMLCNGGYTIVIHPMKTPLIIDEKGRISELDLSTANADVKYHFEQNYGQKKSHTPQKPGSNSD